MSPSRCAPRPIVHEPVEGPPPVPAPALHRVYCRGHPSSISVTYGDAASSPSTLPRTSFLRSIAAFRRTRARSRHGRSPSAPVRPPEQPLPCGHMVIDADPRYPAGPRGPACGALCTELVKTSTATAGRTPVMTGAAAAGASRDGRIAALTGRSHAISPVGAVSTAHSIPGKPIVPRRPGPPSQLSRPRRRARGFLAPAKLRDHVPPLHCHIVHPPRPNRVRTNCPPAVRTFPACGVGDKNDLRRRGHRQRPVALQAHPNAVSSSVKISRPWATACRSPCQPRTVIG